MKLMIEVSGGCVINVVATQECSIYLIDHDNIKQSDIEGKREAEEFVCQPDLITWEEGKDDTPEFNDALNEVMEEYQ